MCQKKSVWKRTLNYFCVFSYSTKRKRVFHSHVLQSLIVRRKQQPVLLWNFSVVWRWRMASVETLTAEPRVMFRKRRKNSSVDMSNNVDKDFLLQNVDMGDATVESFDERSTLVQRKRSCSYKWEYSIAIRFEDRWSDDCVCVYDYVLDPNQIGNLNTGHVWF
jgi:hypothetical protein